MMNKKVLIAVVAAFLLLCCLGSVVVGIIFMDDVKDVFRDDDEKSDDKDDDKRDSEDIKDVKELSEEDQKTFLEESYANYDKENLKLTVDGEITLPDSGDQKIKMEMKLDGENSEIVMKFNSGSIHFIVVDNVTYISNNSDGPWYEMPESDSTTDEYTSEFDSISGNVIDELGDLDDYEYLGKAECGKLVCQKFKTVEDGSETIMYIDTKEHKIRRAEIKDDQGEGFLDFSYDNVSVSKPSNIEQIGDDFDAYLKLLEIMAPLFEGLDLDSLDTDSLDY